MSPPLSLSAGKAGPSRPFQVYLKAPGEKRRPPPEVDALVHLGERPATGLCLHHNLQQFWPLPAGKQDQALGFLLLALGVWAADKTVPRRSQADAWSRAFRLSYPTPGLRTEIAADLVPLLNFLTGDTWTLKPRPIKDSFRLTGVWRQAWQPTAVTLFSGGLDSLIGAIDLLEQGHRLLLVSHYDYGQLASWQYALALALTRHYGAGRLAHLAVRVQFEGPELSLRSRSLLYLALGLMAVSAFPGPLPLFIPENGWISLNPPLTLNRLGTYSTRTTHPAVLEGIRAVWRRAGLSQELINPYQTLTKGEMASRCANLELLQKLAPLSISCARPVAGRWRREKGPACGYCYPCLVRRAALHRLGWDQGRDYRVDVLAEADMVRHRVKGRHLRAVCLALKTWEEDPEEMLIRLTLGWAPEREAAPKPQGVRTLVAAGLAELGRWLEDKGGSGVRRFLGEDRRG